MKLKLLTKRVLIEWTLQCIILLSFSFATADAISQTVQSDCNHLYAKDMLAKKLEYKEICNSFFVIAYDEKINGVRFTSEIINPYNTYKGSNVNFRKDHRLDVEHSPSSYDSKEYDRGHMVPASNARDKNSLEETYLMSNIAPQNPNLNRGKWKSVELAARRAASDTNQSIYVVTVAHYTDTPEYLINIAIPIGFEKRIYTNPPVCYYVQNKQNTVIEKIPCE